jgi:hypothetical protein
VAALVISGQNGLDQRKEAAVDLVVTIKQVLPPTLDIIISRLFDFFKKKVCL